LQLLIDQTPSVALCVFLTCRPTFQAPWSSRSYLTQMTLNHLSRPQIEQMAEQVAGGKRLPAEVLQQIVAKTDGVPLFVEEMTKAMLDAGALTDVNGHYELTDSIAPLAIPATLQDALMARLDRLGTAKGIAQLGATIGRQFSYALLRAVSPLDDAVVGQSLGQLVEAELVYQRGSLPQATFTFKHALIQDAAYESLLRRTRQQLHQQMARVLEAQFPQTTETQPELLAHHYTAGGLHESAIIWWQQAGEHARRQFAFAEAVRHLTQGVTLLQSLAPTPELRQRELDMQLLLGQSLHVVYDRSVPAYLRAYSRARTLCEQLGNTRQLFEVLLGFAYYYQEQGASTQLQETNHQLLALAHDQQDPMRLLQAHNLLGQTLRRLGDLRGARHHLAQAIDLDQRRG
jgi:predicted ATPase